MWRKDYYSRIESCYFIVIYGDRRRVVWFECRGIVSVFIIWDIGKRLYVYFWELMEFRRIQWSKKLVFRLLISY